jgi:hypothetical protein
MMWKLACPLCHRQAIPAWRILVTNHLRSGYRQCRVIVCPTCHGRVGIVSPYELRLFWAQAAALVIAVFAVDSTPLFWSLVAVVVAVGFWGRCRTVSLIRYPDAGLEQQSALAAGVRPGKR